MITCPAAAETRTAQYGAPFCESFASFQAFVHDIVTHREDLTADLDGCVWFKPGVLVERLGGCGTVGGAAVERIRKRGNGAVVEGFTLAEDLVEVPGAATPPPPPAR